MPRAPLALGHYGTVSARRVGARTWAARCRYRELSGDTVQVERRGGSKTAAQNALLDEVRARRGANTETLRPHHRFDRAADAWLRRVDARVESGDLADSSAASYRHRLELTIRPALGRLLLAECTVGRLEMFFDSLAGPGAYRDAVGSPHPYSAAVRRKIRTIVGQVLAVAVRHGAVPANPTRELARITGGSRKPRALTTAERRSWLEWLDGDRTRAQRVARRAGLPDLVRVMLGTGLRIGEVLALRWRDVDLDGIPVADEHSRIRAVAIVAVTGNVTYVKGKGLVRHSGKTTKALRVIPLPRFVVDLLAARRTAGVDPDEPVFPVVRKSGGVGWRWPANVRRSLRVARAQVGLEWMTPHTYRRTAATIWRDAGVLTDQQIADTTGHAHLTTLLNDYIGRGELHPQAAAVMDAAWLDGDEGRRTAMSLDEEG